MKIPSIFHSISLFLVVLLPMASLFQCRKTGDLIKNLDRAYTGGADSTVYAAFYESNPVSPADANPDLNDVVKFRSLQTIVKEYCATGNCHGGGIKPRFDTYADVMRFVTPGNPEGSRLWEFITTNDFDRAMPPVNSSHEVNTSDEGMIYNWIRNGAKERPDLADFRPAAIRLINTGCGSANCHSQATSSGSS